MIRRPPSRSQAVLTLDQTAPRLPAPRDVSRSGFPEVLALASLLSKFRHACAPTPPIVPACTLSHSTLYQLLSKHRLGPGDHVLDATTRCEFTPILEFLGLNLHHMTPGRPTNRLADRPMNSPTDWSSAEQRSSRPRLVIARPEDRSPLELTRATASWLDRLSPRGTLVLIDAPLPDPLAVFPGLCRRWTADGHTFATLTVSSAIRTHSEWLTFTVPTAASGGTHPHASPRGQVA